MGRSSRLSLVALAAFFVCAQHRTAAGFTQGGWFFPSWSTPADQAPDPGGSAPAGDTQDGWWYPSGWVATPIRADDTSQADGTPSDSSQRDTSFDRSDEPDTRSDRTGPRCTNTVGDKAWRRRTIDNRWTGADGARTADVNGDERPDFVVGWEQSGRVTMYISPDYSPRDIGRARDVEDAVFVDLDGDGAVDVVSASEGDTRSVNVHWAPAWRGDYEDASEWEDVQLLDRSNGMREKWMYSLPLDVDGDGNVDLVVGGKDSGIWWLKAPETADRRRSPSRWERHEISPVGWLMSMFAEDMDGDGHQDLVVADRRGGMSGVRWLKHPGGDGTSRWRNYYIKEDINAMFMSSYVDVDGDGTRELVVPTEDKRIYVLRPSEDVYDEWRDSRIDHPRSSRSSSRRSKAVAVGDIDGEGPLDLVVSFENAGGDASGILWSPDFGESWRDVSGRDGIKFDLNQLVDMDGDGDLDILNTEEGDNGRRDALGVIWYENPCR
mmetsp:Transcript_28199/g.73118  ORF Transcript_28199/g.73118 Transcript_28199/m.73118 type:complete len:493 (-) Transcript_28199:389-1867(-)|eukprot:jgi/Tetstr1/434760/TSEL_023811.t1